MAAEQEGPVERGARVQQSHRDAGEATVCLASCARRGPAGRRVFVATTSGQKSSSSSGSNSRVCPQWAGPCAWDPAASVNRCASLRAPASVALDIFDHYETHRSPRHRRVRSRHARRRLTPFRELFRLAQSSEFGSAVDKRIDNRLMLVRE